MNLFQWVTLPPLVVLLVVELITILRRGGGILSLVRALVWLAAALAIAHPEFTSEVASFVGIQRGTDLVLYVFVLAFLGTTFYFYAAQTRLRRELTEMVRHVAIKEARRGDGLP